MNNKEIMKNMHNLDNADLYGTIIYTDFWGAALNVDEGKIFKIRNKDMFTDNSRIEHIFTKGDVIYGLRICDENEKFLELKNKITFNTLNPEFKSITTSSFSVGDIVTCRICDLKPDRIYCRVLDSDLDIMCNIPYAKSINVELFKSEITQVKITHFYTDDTGNFKLRGKLKLDLDNYTNKINQKINIKFSILKSKNMYLESICLLEFLHSVKVSTFSQIEKYMSTKNFNLKSQQIDLLIYERIIFCNNGYYYLAEYGFRILESIKGVKLWYESYRQSMSPSKLSYNLKLNEILIDLIKESDYEIKSFSTNFIDTKNNLFIDIKYKTDEFKVYVFLIEQGISYLKLSQRLYALNNFLDNKINHNDSSSKSSLKIIFYLEDDSHKKIIKNLINDFNLTFINI